VDIVEDENEQSVDEEEDEISEGGTSLVVFIPCCDIFDDRVCELLEDEQVCGELVVSPEFDFHNKNNK